MPVTWSPEPIEDVERGKLERRQWDEERAVSAGPIHDTFTLPGALSTYIEGTTEGPSHIITHDCWLTDVVASTAVVDSANFTLALVVNTVIRVSVVVPAGDLTAFVEQGDIGSNGLSRGDILQVQPVDTGTSGATGCTLRFNAYRLR